MHGHRPCDISINHHQDFKRELDAIYHVGLEVIT